jgi:hypothetical protein
MIKIKFLGEKNEKGLHHEPSVFQPTAERYLVGVLADTVVSISKLIVIWCSGTSAGTVGVMEYNRISAAEISLRRTR